MVPVKLEGDCDCLKHLVLVQNSERIERETGLAVEDAVIAAPESGVAQIVVHYRSGFTQCVPRGACLGEGETAQVCSAPGPSESDPGIATVKQTTSGTEVWRKAKLLETMELPDLPPPDSELLQQFLVDHHDVFSLEMVSVEKLTLCTWRSTRETLAPRSKPQDECRLLSAKRWRSS